MPSRKVRLEICGTSYVISTNDSENYMLGLAERLDEDMKQVLKEAPNASISSAAIITALGYLDESVKAAHGADNMRTQLQDYLEDAAKARAAAEEARREAEKLRRELQYYENKAGKSSAAKSAPLLHDPADDPAPEKTENIVLPGQMGLDEL